MLAPSLEGSLKGDLSPRLPGIPLPPFSPHLLQDELPSFKPVSSQTVSRESKGEEDALKRPRTRSTTGGTSSAHPPEPESARNSCPQLGNLSPKPRLRGFQDRPFSREMPFAQGTEMLSSGTPGPAAGCGLAQEEATALPSLALLPSGGRGGRGICGRQI